MINGNIFNKETDDGVEKEDTNIGDRVKKMMRRITEDKMRNELYTEVKKRIEKKYEEILKYDNINSEQDSCSLDDLVCELGYERIDEKVENLKFSTTREELIMKNEEETIKKGMIIQYDTSDEIKEYRMDGVLKKRFGKKYAILKNINHFPEIILRYPAVDRTLYEIIQPNQLHKGYCDFDWKINKYPYLTDELVSKYMRIIECVIKFTFNEIYPDFDISYDNILIYSASLSGIKYSFHIILNGFLFVNNRETKLFITLCSSICDFICDIINKELNTNIYCIPFDLSVYKNWQAFRTPYSEKRCSYRPLLPFNISAANSSVLCALLTYSSNCYSLPNILPLSPLPINTPSPSLTFENIVSINNFNLKDFIYNNNLTIRSIINNKIILNNNGGFHCPRCLETHHNENPYITVSGFDIYFCCRQAPSIIINRGSMLSDVSF